MVMHSVFCYVSMCWRWV